jgi:hypothetical protein
VGTVLYEALVNLITFFSILGLPVAYLLDIRAKNPSTLVAKTSLLGLVTFVLLTVLFWYLFSHVHVTWE